jgi:hypothetical protein
MNEPLRAIRLYSHGQITDVELFMWVFGTLTQENIRDVLTGCPDEILQLLRKTVSALPDDGDDEGWAKPIFIRCAVYASGVTEDDIRQSKEEENHRFRQAVGVFRANDHS